jgi:hypothetical protein
MPGTTEVSVKLVHTAGAGVVVMAQTNHFCHFNACEQADHQLRTVKFVLRIIVKNADKGGTNSVVHLGAFIRIDKSMQVD